MRTWHELSGSKSKKTRENSEVWWEKRVLYRIIQCIYLVQELKRIFSLNFHVVRISQFFRVFALCFFTSMPSIWNRFVLEKEWHKNDFFLRKRPNRVGHFEGLWLVGTQFRRYRQPWALDEIKGYATLFRCSWQTQFGAFCLDLPVRVSRQNNA